MSLLDGAGAKTLPGNIIQCLQMRVKQKDIDGIHIQLGNGLSDDCIQDGAQVKGGGDRAIY